MTPEIIKTKNKLPGQIFGQLGNMVTRLATSPDEIKAAQAIRNQVFGSEYHAAARPKSQEIGENDTHDMLCDHLLVSDITSPNAEKIIGTQRLFVSRPGEKAPFYSQAEFDVAQLRERHQNAVFMELGRSCILPEWRGKRTMELLWQGTWAFAVENCVDVMIGCASFPTTETHKIAQSLLFLQKHAKCEPGWETFPTSDAAIDIATLESSCLDDRAAMRTLPPLIKGYLRLGAMFSDHAVIDHEFGSIDVLVVLPVNRISPRYLNYYGQDASKHRAS